MALVVADRNGLTSKLEDVLVTVLRTLPSAPFYSSEGLFFKRSDPSPSTESGLESRLVLLIGISIITHVKPVTHPLREWNVIIMQRV